MSRCRHVVRIQVVVISMHELGVVGVDGGRRGRRRCVLNGDHLKPVARIVRFGLKLAEIEKNDDYVLADWWGSRGCAHLIMDQTFHDLMRFREIFAKCRDIPPQERLQPSGNPRSVPVMAVLQPCNIHKNSQYHFSNTNRNLSHSSSFTWKYMSTTIGQDGTGISVLKARNSTSNE